MQNKQEHYITKKKKKKKQNQKRYNKKKKKKKYPKILSPHICSPILQEWLGIKNLNLVNYALLCILGN